MADKKNSVKTTNSVKVVGYLKENNLEQITNSRGDQVIRGSIIIAVDEVSSHRIQFYVAAKTKAGEDSKDYEGLSKLLPNNTITIASFLKENPTADFQTAANAASKVWAMARFEEYATRVGERVRSLVTLKGFRAGFKTAADAAPFKPCAEFEVNGFVNALIPEVDANNNETGRVVVELAMPLYDGSVQLIDFIAPTEGNVANYITSNYAQTNTVVLKGDVISIQEKKLKDGDGDFFGRGSEPQYETRFIRERRILGGCKTPIKDGEEGSFTSKLVKDGLASREIKMDANGEKAEKAKAAKEEASATVTSTAAAVAGFEDGDF